MSTSTCRRLRGLSASTNNPAGGGPRPRRRNPLCGSRFRTRSKRWWLGAERDYRSIGGPGSRHPGNPPCSSRSKYRRASDGAPGRPTSQTGRNPSGRTATVPIRSDTAGSTQRGITPPDSGAAPPAPHPTQRLPARLRRPAAGPAPAGRGPRSFRPILAQGVKVAGLVHTGQAAVQFRDGQAAL